MDKDNVISLTQKLLAFNTVNPPGNEYKAAEFVGDLLARNGFQVDYLPFEENRMNIVAEKGCSDGMDPIVFTGHFDTVPLGAAEWTVDPFGGEIKGDKVFGRGSSDMKGAVAAMVIAAIQSFEIRSPEGGIRLVLTSGEEFGCRGAKFLVSTHKNIGRASGLVVGEPTSNRPGIGHKGGLFLKLTTSGTTAHSSMPHLGDNAIYKVARAISKIEQFKVAAEEDPLLGFPTVNVGQVFGGLNINSVPDSAGFTIDARTTVNTDHNGLLEELQKELGGEINIETLADLPAVSSDEKDPFIRMVYKACGISKVDKDLPLSLPYLTDGSVLQKAFNYVPTVILGPGQPEMAHQTDEFCYTSRLKQAVEIYKNIILRKEFS